MFAMFDQDKVGYIGFEDLNALINALHNVKSPDTVAGNAKISWGKLEFATENITYEEFARVHDTFPRMFEPAFRLQQQMTIKFMGELFWINRKRTLQDQRDEADAKIRKINEQKLRRARNKTERKIQRNMGLIKYFCCPCLRRFYDPTKNNGQELTEEQKAEKEREIARMRREQALKLKNPETAQWQKFQTKIKSQPVTATKYLQQKHNLTERPREERALSRAERRKERKKDPDLQYKARETVSGVDI